MAAPIPAKDQPVRHYRAKERYDKKDYDGFEGEDTE